MKLTFALIGAAKSGTSSIYAYLKQHPEVFLSDPKEPKFFQWDGEQRHFDTALDKKIFANSISNWEEYQALFRGSENATAVGEASVSYLYNRHCAERMQARFPNIKLLAVLRRPDERAFSQYVQTKWMGYEPLEFIDALAAEEQRISDNWGPSWHYARQGYYTEQLARYYRYFDASQIKVWPYDDLKSQPEVLMKEMYEFLEIDVTFEADMSTTHNVRTFPKRAGLSQLINGDSWLKKILKRVTPESIKTKIKSSNEQRLVMPDDIRMSLISRFRDEITDLEEMLGRDLSAWRQIPS